MLPFDTAQRALRFDSVSSGLLASRIIYTGRVTLVSLQGYNKAGAARYIHLFDAAPASNANPLVANGAKPVVVIKAASGENFFAESIILGLPFQNGIVLAVSTTEDTLTLDGTSEVLVWGTVVPDGGQ